MSVAAEKVRRRCPHVFAGEAAPTRAAAEAAWQREKRRERELVQIPVRATGAAAAAGDAAGAASTESDAVPPSPSPSIRANVKAEMAAAEAAGSAAVLKERGGAAFKAGEFDEAAQLYEAAAAAQPEDATHAANQSFALLRAGDAEGAVACVSNNALMLCGGWSEARLGLGQGGARGGPPQARVGESALSPGLCADGSGRVERGRGELGEGARAR